jgi:outer membrane protein OmpA-like peptidoglycan-associated protein/outer membrane protein assembly factor BamB
MRYRLPLLLTLLLLVPSVCLPVVQENWPTYMGNQYLTGNNDGIIPESDGILWTFNSPGKLYNPVSVNNRVYVVSTDSNLYCLDSSDGSLLWSFKSEGPLTRMVCVYKDRVYLPAGRFLYCLDAANGNVLWARRDQSFGFYGTPTIAGDRLFYGNRKGFYARELRNGHLLWENHNIYTYGGFPSYWNGMVYTVSKEFQEEAARLVALNETDGSVRWETVIENVPNIYSPVVYDGRIYLAFGNKLAVFDAETGELRYEKTFPAQVASNTAFSNGRIFLSLSDGRIMTVNPKDGRFEHLFTAPYWTQFAIVGSHLFVPLKGSGAGDTAKIAVVDADSGLVTRSISLREGEPSALTVARGTLFLPASGTLYAVGDGRLLAKASGSGAKPEAGGTETVRGSLRDRDSGTPLSGTVESTTKSADGGIVRKEAPISGGSFEIEVPKTGVTDLVFSSPGYTFETMTIASAEAVDDLTKMPLDMSLPKAKKGERITIDSLQFKTGSANLEPESLAVLDRLLKMMQDNPSLEIEIAGHTDSTGTPEVNLGLSRLRAETAADWLIRNGILSKRIRTAGYGDTKPVSDNSTEEGRRKNRRTEIMILDD